MNLLSHNNLNWLREKVSECEDKSIEIQFEKEEEYIKNEHSLEMGRTPSILTHVGASGEERGKRIFKE